MTPPKIQHHQQQNQVTDFKRIQPVQNKITDSLNIFSSADADNNNTSLQKKEDNCTAASTTASPAAAINNCTDSENHPSAALLKAEQLCIGVEFSCLLTDHGQAYLFDVATGTLGALLTEESIVAVSAGQEHVLLLAVDGTVLSFGHGSRGQLGHGTLDNVSEKAIPIEALQVRIF